MTDGFRRPPTAQAAVLTALRRSIVSGELGPGQQIRQDALAQRFGVSRVPLREALKILEGEGQVTYQPHRGYFVSELSVTDLREVYRIRDLLETEAAEVAVRLLDEDGVARMAAAAAAVEVAADQADVLAMADANRQFHFTLLQASGMPRLVRLIRILWDATDVYRSLYYADAPHRRDVREEHADIVAAVRRRDADGVIALLRNHREHAVDAVTRAIEQPAASGKRLDP